MLRNFTMNTSPFFKALEAAYQLHFYLVFKTKYLHPLLADPAQKSLVHNTFETVCSREDYHLLDTSITPNHIKILVSLKPQQTISNLVQKVKGNLSYQFGVESRDLLRRFDIKSFLASGYFARSSGKVNLEAARRYVETQAAHHGHKGEWIKPLSCRNATFRSPAFKLAHCFCILDYHVVLATQSRISVFDEAIAPSLFEYLMSVGNKHGFVLDRMGLMPDHIHLILEGIPTLSIEECVRAILNNTHHWMTKQFWGVLKETGAWDVWQPSFYAGTVGAFSTAQVRRFLNQRS
jgi:putative transposase